MVRRWQKQMFIDGAEYFSLYLASMPVSEITKRHLEAWAGIENLEGTVLDIGCGPGRFLEFFASRARKVIGVDISRPFLEQAKKRALPRVRLVESDIALFLAETKLKFNAIFRLYTSLGYFSRSDERQLLMKCLRVSAPKAILVVDSFNGDFFRSRIEYFRLIRTGDLLLHQEYRWDATHGRVACFWRFLRGQCEVADEIMLSCPPWIEFSRMYPLVAPLQEIRFNLDAYDRCDVLELASSCGWHVRGIYEETGGRRIESLAVAPERLIAVLENPSEEPGNTSGRDRTFDQ